MYTIITRAETNTDYIRIYSSIFTVFECRNCYLSYSLIQHVLSVHIHTMPGCLMVVCGQNDNKPYKEVSVELVPFWNF